MQYVAGLSNTQDSQSLKSSAGTYTDTSVGIREDVAGPKDSPKTEK